MYYTIGIILIALTIVLLIWAIVDIMKSKKNNKGIIFLLLITPVIGPLIYFQSKNKL